MSYSIKSLYDGSSYFYAEERFLKKSCRTIELEYEQERIVQLNKDIEEGWNDTTILDGHSAMEKLIKKYE